MSINAVSNLGAIFLGSQSTNYVAVDSAGEAAKGVRDMAASSITKNFVVEGEEQVEIFANAIEESANAVVPERNISVRYLDDPEEIAEFLKKREKKG